VEDTKQVGRGFSAACEAAPFIVAKERTLQKTDEEKY
jgi:hypothetical protein